LDEDLGETQQAVVRVSTERRRQGDRLLRPEGAAGLVLRDADTPGGDHRSGERWPDRHDDAGAFDGWRVLRRWGHAVLHVLRTGRHYGFLPGVHGGDGAERAALRAADGSPLLPGCCPAGWHR